MADSAATNFILMFTFSSFSVCVCVQDPRVLDAMLPYQVNYYGNPHSRTHAYGWESETAMETARKVQQERKIQNKM